jgi:formylglycine-generating enzyme required for sulfatase activity
VGGTLRARFFHGDHVVLIALKLKLAVLAGALAAPVMMHAVAPTPVVDDTEFANLAPADFNYRMAGDFARAGRPVDPLHSTTRLSETLRIMKRQVTVAEYRQCIEASACPRIALADAGRDMPVVGVNWHDAEAYAIWRSKMTGLTYRLPTDREWTFAAAESVKDEVAPLIDPTDPAQAWIARYEAESARAGSLVLAPQPVGAFGRNSNGLLDVGGNVWEWTSSCFVRATLDGEGMRVTNTNCGVRVVEGAHRTYMTDFIRDPRTGGCAAGVPPANLGFRLVVVPRRSRMRAMVSEIFGRFLPISRV